MVRRRQREPRSGWAAGTARSSAMIVPRREHLARGSRGAVRHSRHDRGDHVHDRLPGRDPRTSDRRARRGRRVGARRHPRDADEPAGGVPPEGLQAALTEAGIEYRSIRRSARRRRCGRSRPRTGTASPTVTASAYASPGKSSRASFPSSRPSASACSASRPTPAPATGRCSPMRSRDSWTKPPSTTFGRGGRTRPMISNTCRAAWRGCRPRSAGLGQVARPRTSARSFSSQRSPYSRDHRAVRLARSPSRGCPARARVHRSSSQVNS